MENITNLSEKKRAMSLVIVVCILLLIIISISVTLVYSSTHRFEMGTQISNVDCSGLSPFGALKTVQKHFTQDYINFVLPDQTISIKATDFDFQIPDEEFEKLLAEQRKNKDKLEFSLNSIEFNKNAIDKILSKEYIKNNAYLKFNEENNLFEIVPGGGYALDVSKATSFVYEQLKAGEKAINLTTFCELPITAEQLSNKLTELNNILSTQINFSMSNTASMFLDSSVIKDWIVNDENGEFSIDIDNNLPIFIDKLNDFFSYSINKDITATNSQRKITIKSINVGLDKEAELNEIKQNLGKTVTLAPIYKSYSNDPVNSYVEIDLSRQHVWMYVGGTCIVDTPCVTGCVATGHTTPTGIYYLTYKTTDTYLRGKNDDGSNYKSHVNYWMPFNGNVGMHDALWRNSFGGTINKTNGSHGCVNLPLGAAKKIYENINTSMPIVVYE